jgi:1-acyl-sn-glycerol-3-phosphate acyltransferase
VKILLSAILTPIFFLVFGLILAVFHPIQVIARNIFGAHPHDKTVFALNFWLMKALHILGVRYSFHNFKKLPKDVPIIIICNHQSMWDIPTIIWKFRAHRPKFVAKKELAKGIPSISYNLRNGGSVSIDRKDPKGAVLKIKAFAKSVKENCFAVCIFPEGTRSRNGKIKPFKVAGVKTLMDEIPEALVVPVAIKNTGIIDNNGKFLKNIGVRVSFTQLESRSLNLENLESELIAINAEIKSILES